MTILITGVAGFIGSNFARQFKNTFKGSKIIGIDNFSGGRKEELIEGITFYEGSVTDETLLEQIFSKDKIDYVFHFAALPRVSYSVEYPVETTHVNVTGTVSLLTAAKNHKVKRFIFSSSSAIYGYAKILPTKEIENLPDPQSPYAAQKLCDEIFCKLYSNIFKLDTVCLRYFNVFGTGDYGDSAYSTVIAAWLKGLYFPEGKLPFIEGNGEQSRDLSFVDNIVFANILAMQSEKPFMGEVFNIADGYIVTLNEIRDLIEEHSGRTLNLEQREARIGDVLHTHADFNKAREWFGYEPKTNFIDGLKQTIAWFEERSKSSSS